MNYRDVMYVIKHEDRGYLLGPESMLGFSWNTNHICLATYSTRDWAESVLKDMDYAYKGDLFRPKCKVVVVRINERFDEIKGA